MDLLPHGYSRDEKPLRQLERIGTSERASERAFESRKSVARKYKSSAAVPLHLPAMAKKVVPLKCENRGIRCQRREQWEMLSIRRCSRHALNIIEYLSST